MDVESYQMEDFESFLRGRFEEYKKIASWTVKSGTIYPELASYEDVSEDERGSIDALLHQNGGVYSDPIKSNIFFKVAHKEYFNEYMEMYENWDEKEKLAPWKRFEKLFKTEFRFQERLVKEIIRLKNKHDNFETLDCDIEGNNVDPDLFRDFTRCYTQFFDNRKEYSGFIDEAGVAHSDSIGGVYDKFLMQRRKEVKENTILHYGISFDFLFEFFDRSEAISKYSKSCAVDLKSKLLSKKANSTKGSEKKTLAVKTVNRYLSHYSKFFNWAVKHYHTKSNPFSGLLLEESMNTVEKMRRPYSSEEAIRILSYQFGQREAVKIREAAYWFPKIAFYTGMRLNEISVLKVVDLKSEDGIYYLNLLDKKLKTKNSRRQIPIHSELLKFGFVDFFKSKKDYVFPELTHKGGAKRDGWGEPISKWYNRNVLKNLGIEKESDGTTLNFHAIRNTVLSIFKHEGLNGYLVKQIAGHSPDDDMTFTVYGSEVSTKMQVLQSIIEKIVYK